MEIILQTTDLKYFPNVIFTLRGLGNINKSHQIIVYILKEHILFNLPLLLVMLSCSS